jgi:hypothetical protein
MFPPPSITNSNTSYITIWKPEKFLVNDKNIKIVRAAIEEYPGSAPVKRIDLTNYLNNHFNKP